MNPQDCLTFPYLPFQKTPFTLRQKRRFFIHTFPWGCSDLSKKHEPPDQVVFWKVKLAIANVGLSVKYGLLPFSADDFPMIQNFGAHRLIFLVYSKKDDHLVGIAKCTNIDPNSSFKYWLAENYHYAGIVNVKYIQIGEEPFSFQWISNKSSREITYQDYTWAIEGLQNTFFMDSYVIQGCEHEYKLREKMAVANREEKVELENYFQYGLKNLKERLGR